MMELFAGVVARVDIIRQHQPRPDRGDPVPVAGRLARHTRRLRADRSLHAESSHTKVTVVPFFITGI